MSVKPVSVKLNSASNKEANKENHNQKLQLTPSQNKADSVSFGNAGNFVVMFMDGIERGGFAASFLAQDGVGMVAPRIIEGLNRNKEETGHLNWDFAKREGLRECLSGPSVFLIPAAILYFIKKFSGKANNVPVDYIKAFGKEFEDYSNKNIDITNKTKTQQEFFEQIYKNILKTSTNNQMPDEEINKTAKSFAEKLIKADAAKSKGFMKKLQGKPVAGSKEDLLDEISNEFISIRKKFMPPSTAQWNAELTVGENKTLATSFTSMSKKLLDYSDDVTKHAQEYIKGNKTGKLAEFVKNHTTRRMGSRAISNIGMWLAVVGFYALIPKIYNMGLDGKNPGMAGLEEDTPAKIDSKQNAKSNAEQVNFKGKKEIFTKVAEKVTSSKGMKKASDFFEFDGASMTTNSTLALLFGFCLPTRLANASDKHDNKEIMTRDLFSFSAILFGANAISRGFSKLFTSISGLALNTTPSDHDKSFIHKFKNYFNPNGGIGVFKSDEITAKYSNVHEYKNGINGFFDFVQENGGNLKRMLAIDPEIKKHSEKILNKKLEDAKNSEIEAAFKKAKGSEALNAIYENLKNPNNKLVKRAKILNSSFGFASIIVLVPGFMIWLAKHCEKMTKADITKEKFTETAKNYMHDDFASADLDTIKALDEKVLNDIKANKIYGYKYDANKNIIRDLTGKEKQVSDVRVQIKEYVDKATPKGQKRIVHKPEITPKNADYQMFLTSKNQLKENFLTK